jgi:hypothetical protein
MRLNDALDTTRTARRTLGEALGTAAGTVPNQCSGGPQRRTLAIHRDDGDDDVLRQMRNILSASLARNWYLA